jgi:hypothetical protein
MFGSQPIVEFMARSETAPLGKCEGLFPDQ